MSDKQRKKSLVGWISPDWHLRFISKKFKDAGFIEFTDITKCRYYGSEKKVRITIEEIK